MIDNEKKLLGTVGVAAAGILLLAFVIYFFAIREGARISLQGRLIKRTDGSPVVGATLYASDTPLLALSRRPSEQKSEVLGGTSAAPLPVVGKTAADGSFRVEVPNTPGAAILAVHDDLAAVLGRAASLKGKSEIPELFVESPCSLTGFVYDERGSSLGDTFLSLLPFGLTEKPRWQTWSDKDGQFRFDRLPAGRLTVSALYPRRPDSVNVEYTTSAVVVVGAGQESVIRFGPSGSLTGVAKDSQGNPIPNAEIVVRSTGFSAAGRLAANLRTKASGQFRVYALPPLDYRVFVRNQEKGTHPEWFDLGPIFLPRDGEKWKDLQLAALTTQVRVAPESSDHPFPKVLPSTQKPPLIRLLFFPKGSSQPSYDLTNEMPISKDGFKGVYDARDGFFFVRHVQPDEYTVVAQVEGYGAGVLENYRVEAGQKPKAINLPVTRGGPVIVRVVDANQKEIPHAIVSIYLEDRIEIVRGKPGEDLCPGPGTFNLRVEADGYKMKSQEFHVLVATKKNFDVALEPE